MGILSLVQTENSHSLKILFWFLGRLLSKTWTSDGYFDRTIERESFCRENSMVQKERLEGEETQYEFPSDFFNERSECSQLYGLSQVF